MLCIKKYLSCRNGSFRGDEELKTQLDNETKTFCATCFNYSHLKNNFEMYMYSWLKNFSCVSELLEKDKSGTPGELYTVVFLYIEQVKFS